MESIINNLSHYFKHTVFPLFKTDSSKNKAIKLIAILAFGLLALSHMLYRNWKYRHNYSVQQHIPSISKKVVILPEFPIQVVISPKVSPILNKLFENSPYSIDTLPTYSTEIKMKNKKLPERAKMTHPIMKGKIDDGRAFIIIKVDCDSIETKRSIGTNKDNLEKTIILYELEENEWFQVNMKREMEPLFFTENFIDSNEVAPSKEQEKSFTLLQTLVKTGKGADINGKIWSIPGHKA